MPLYDVTVGLDPMALRQANWKFYWWALGRWALVVAAGCWALGLVSLGLRLGSELYWVLMILGLVVVAEAFLFPFLQGNSRRNSLNQGDFRFVADEQGLRVDGPFGTQTIRWGAYSRALRDDQFLYLMISRRTVQIVPLSGAADPARLLDHLASVGLRPRRLDMLAL